MVSEGDDSGDRDPSEPFALVGNETRAAILQSLAERQRRSPDAPHLSFSELRERVGVRDSGQFNYHLDRLQGRLVEKDGDGYRLSFQGLRVVGAIAARAYDADFRRGPESLPGECPYCAASLVAAYAEGAFRVTCENDHTFQQNLLPSAIEGHSMTEAAGLMTLTLHQDLQLARRGVCPVCHGRMTPRVEFLSRDYEGYAFRASCTRCGAVYTSTPGAPLAFHPGVLAFHHDHGVDLRERPFWDLALYRDDCVAAAGTDPLRVRVEVSLDDEVLGVTLDAEADVVSAERRRN